ncbi:hypothetical protein ACNAW0_10455 [Micromonospora sp. SL1-18]|uniref:hypothetical protein n=1 Tax=Micromonospora sp. SL1-18 TaxID=3399128 RepID=UPI003A4E638B
MSVLWAALGVGAVGLGATEDPGDTSRALILISLLALLLGVWVFWRDGGRAITAVGLYNLAFALFVGFSGLYQADDVAWTGLSRSLLTAVAFCYFTQVATWALFWRESVRLEARSPLPVNVGPLRWAVGVGAALLIAATATAMARPDSLPPLVEPAGFVGVLLMTAGLVRGRLRRQWVVWGVLLVGAMMLYFDFLFNDYGRIKLASLALGIAVLLAGGRNGRWVKSGVLAFSAPALWFFAQLRVDPTNDESGLGSVMSPLREFARVLELNDLGGFPKGWGHTFWASLVALIPRGMWPGKPVGFGTEIVAYVRPELVDTGHSSAVLFHGEWVFNFGLLGLVAMVPVVGYALRGLDRLLVSCCSQGISDRRQVLWQVAVVVATTGMVDLMWVGSFTYVARVGSRLLVILALILVFGQLGSRRTEQPDAGRRAARPGEMSTPPRAAHRTGLPREAPGPTSGATPSPSRRPGRHGGPAR